ncbi:MAG: 30S ribosome-binding factor RbfA [Chloroflexi bacterium]|nr:30S ribosome-binding factor RbfA [Chloroflexota bacterium]
MSRHYRKERLDELLYRELNTLVLYELNDPRLADISISSVDVSRDLQTARVYVNMLDEETVVRQVLQGLEKASGFLRSEIAARINLRKAPELYFRIDTSYQEAKRIDNILDSIPPYIEEESDREGNTE